VGVLNKFKYNRPVLLVTALPVEARPLASALNLKFHSHGEYRNDKFTLIITGVGRIASAISTTKAFSLNGDYESALNFGLCGSGNAKHEIGEMRYVNRIREMCTGRDFFPDPLISHQWKESAIQCHDLPVQDRKVMDFDPLAEIVDMESAGFFQAAVQFLPPHSIHCIKVVSDYLNVSKQSIKVIEALIHVRISEISIFLERICRSVITSPPKIPTDLQQAIDAISKSWRLTKTQVHKLNRTAIGANLRGADLGLVIDNCKEVNPTSKTDRNAAFKNLCRELAK